MNYFLVTYRQTDRRKATHNSPTCMSKGGLKSLPTPMRHSVSLIETLGEIKFPNLYKRSILVILDFQCIYHLQVCEFHASLFSQNIFSVYWGERIFSLPFLGAGRMFFVPWGSSCGWGWVFSSVTWRSMIMWLYILVLYGTLGTFAAAMLDFWFRAPLRLTPRCPGFQHLLLKGRFMPSDIW